MLDAEDPLPEDSACLSRWMRSGPAPSQAPAADQPAFERKRLQLKPRSLPAPGLPTPPEPKPEEPKAERQPQAAPAAPKPRSNPFGQARPREEVLKEKGVSESGSDKVDRWGTSCKEPQPALRETAGGQGLVKATCHASLIDHLSSCAHLLLPVAAGGLHL